MGCPGWGPGTESGGEVKLKEISIQYGLQLILMYQHWFINCNKCSIQILDVNNRETDYGVWEPSAVSSQFFCKSKTALKYKLY